MVVSAKIEVQISDALVRPLAESDKGHGEGKSVVWYAFCSIADELWAICRNVDRIVTNH